jgi:membrane-associated protein
LTRGLAEVLAAKQVTAHDRLDPLHEPTAHSVQRGKSAELQRWRSPLRFGSLGEVKVLAELSANYSVLAVFVVMLLKEIGIPVPIPSDLIMVGAGVQIAAGAYSPLELLVALTVAVAVGGSIQFLLARSAGRAVVYRVAARIGIGAARLDRAVARLASGGARAVLIGLNIPGARAAVIPAAGLARLAFLRFAVAAITGSLVFYGWHILLGYLVGPVATELLGRYSTPLLAALIILSLAGLAGWLWMRRRSGSAARSWVDAACPACLAMTALGPR